MSDVELAPSIDVTIEGKTREVLMSFTLLNQLVRAVGDFDNVGKIIVDHDLRDALLTIFIQVRDERGRHNPEEVLSLDDAGLSVDDALAALTFITEHVADFFVKQLKMQMETGEKHGELLQKISKALGLSVDGSQG